MPYTTLKGKKIRFRVVSKGMTYGKDDARIYNKDDTLFLENNPIVFLYSEDRPHCDGYAPLASIYLETLLSKDVRESNLYITPQHVLSQKENDRMAIALETVKRLLNLGK